MHMINRKDLNSAELETVRTSRCPTTVITVNGAVQTHEEATDYVRELGKCLIVTIFDDTPVVLSLGKIFEDTDIHISGPMVKNHVSLKNGVRIQCNTESYVPIVVLGLSTTSSASSSSATPTSLPQESTGSVPIPASVDSERADEQERRSAQFRTQPKIQNQIKLRITSHNG